MSRVTLDRAGDRVVVTVRDDGRGATVPTQGPTEEATDDPRLGLGIAGMRQRVQARSGTFEAGPAEPSGRGWRVRVELPA